MRGGPAPLPPPPPREMLADTWRAEGMQSAVVVVGTPLLFCSEWSSTLAFKWEVGCGCGQCWAPPCAMGNLNLNVL